MARLPGSEALGERPVPVLPRRTPMVAEYRPTSGFEGAGAEQMQHSAAEMASAAQVVYQAKEQQDTLAAEDAFNTLRQKQMDLTYGKDGIMNQKGAATVNRDLPAEYGGQLQATANELGKSLGNDNQRLLFSKRAQTAQMQLQEHAFQHVARESDVYANQVLQGTLDTESRVVSAGGDIPTSMLRINTSIDRHAQRFGTPEQEVTSLKMKAADGIWTSKIKATIYTDPMAAQALLKEHSAEIGPANRFVLEHEVKTAVRPVEAKGIAQQAMLPAAVENAGAAMEVGGEPAITPVVNKEAGGAFPKESPSEALSRAQASLGILKSEQKERPDDAALQREIARTETLISGLGNSAAPTQASIKQPGIPATSRDLRAQLGTFVTRGEALAEQMHPGDAVFRDQVISQIKGNISTIAASFEGEQRQAHGTLLAHLAGGPDGKAAKPTTMDELMALPGSREAYTKLDPGSLHGITAALQHNQIEAMGRPVKTDPKVEKELFDRIHMPDDDPKKISSPAQLTPFFAQGINQSSYDWLKKELDQQMSPGGRNFSSDIREAINSAHRRFLTSPIGSIQPDKAEDASYKFRFDLTRKIDEYTKAGKDPRGLITPGSADFMLTPERLGTYMPSTRATVAAQSKEKMPVVASDADYEKLPAGSMFTDNSGKTWQKPAATPAAQVRTGKINRGDGG